jgi:glycine/D-amino acid oxidase-like deaminating enzyme
MASPFANGEIILGDSHEYGDDLSPFDKPLIDELILRELKKVICLKDWTIQERWHGIYAKHPELPVFEAQVGDEVTVFVGTGGAGMTLAFGLAEQAWKRWTGQSHD